MTLEHDADGRPEEGQHLHQPLGICQKEEMTPCPILPPGGARAPRPLLQCPCSLRALTPGDQGGCTWGPATAARTPPSAPVNYSEPKPPAPPQVLTGGTPRSRVLGGCSFPRAPAMAWQPHLSPSSSASETDRPPGRRVRENAR